MQLVQTKAERPASKWRAVAPVKQTQDTAKPAVPAVQGQMLRPKTAAQLLGVGVATLWRWSSRPDFPKARHLSARCTVFDRAELLAWADGQKK